MDTSKAAADISYTVTADMVKKVIPVPGCGKDERIARRMCEVQMNEDRTKRDVFVGSDLPHLSDLFNYRAQGVSPGCLLVVVRIPDEVREARKQARKAGLRKLGL